MNQDHLSWAEFLARYDLPYGVAPAVVEISICEEFMKRKNIATQASMPLADSAAPAVVETPWPIDQQALVDEHIQAPAAVDQHAHLGLRWFTCPWFVLTPPGEQPQSTFVVGTNAVAEISVLPLGIRVRRLDRPDIFITSSGWGLLK